MTLTVVITDSEGKTVCEETKNETSNDFGVISMSVGDSESFANADWSKLPFFIEASVDGRLLGKSQLFSVPVAEYAKKTGTLTKELLCSKEWTFSLNDRRYVLKFKDNDKIVEIYYSGDYKEENTGTYLIDGNFVSIVFDNGHSGELYHFNESHGCLINEGVYK